MKCNKCGYDYSNSGDSAHVCEPTWVADSKTQVAEHIKYYNTMMQDDVDERSRFEKHWISVRGKKKAERELEKHPLQPQTYIQDSANRHWVTRQAATTPQQRTWVGLTYEEIDYQAKKDDHGVYFALGALWAEAKLKEKNNGTW